MKFKFTWAHGVIVALGCFIIFILGIIFFGSRMLFPNGDSNSELVTENYYEDELVYQKVIDAKKNADQLPQKLQYAQLPEGIKITFPSDITNDNAKINYYLYRTNDKTQDRFGSVKLDENSSFIIPKNFLIIGSYTLKINWTKDKKEYQIDYDVEWK